MIETVKKYISKLIEKGGISDTKLQMAINKYSIRINSLTESSKEQTKPHCLFDWILLATKYDKKAISFLDFINTECEHVFSQTDHKLHAKLRSIIKNIVLSIDTNIDITNNPTYLNYVGELAGLSHILKIGNAKFELTEIESKLLNNKQADFVFYNKETTELLYVDFVSIHNIDISKCKNDSEFISFLESRFNQKLESKTFKLTEYYNKIEIANNTTAIFAILPIIWTETRDLLPFINAFKTIDEKYANIFTCCSILPQLLANGKYEYSFTSITNILELWN